MLDFLNEPISLAVLVSAAIFTLFGHYSGFKMGYGWYSKLLVRTLALEGYVKYRTLANGEIELIKLNED